MEHGNSLEAYSIGSATREDIWNPHTIGPYRTNIERATGFLRAVLKITASLRLKAAVADDGEVDAFEAYGHEYTQDMT